MKMRESDDGSPPKPQEQGQNRPPELSTNYQPSFPLYLSTAHGLIEKREIQPKDRERERDSWERVTRIRVGKEVGLRIGTVTELVSEIFLNSFERESLFGGDDSQGSDFGGVTVSRANKLHFGLDNDSLTPLLPTYCRSLKK